MATVVVISANALAYHHGKPGEWLLWLLLNVMIGTGIWFLRAWQTNRWARELVELEAENQFIRLSEELEQEAENRKDETGDT